MVFDGWWNWSFVELVSESFSGEMGVHLDWWIDGLLHSFAWFIHKLALSLGHTKC